MNRINALILSMFFLFNVSFGLDRCDIYGLFLKTCADFGVNHDFDACNDFESELLKILKSKDKSTKLFVDACTAACKGGVLNKGLSNFGVETFVKMCKIFK